MLLSPKTLASKLTITFWVLALLLAGAQCYLLTVLWHKGVSDLAQQFNSDLADIYAAELRQHYQEGFKQRPLRIAISKLREFNPRISIFFIDTKGKVRFNLHGDDNPDHPGIDVRPIEYFVNAQENRRFPIYVQNPEYELKPAVFSATRVEVGKEPMYLLVILLNRSFVSGQTGIEDQYIIVGGIATSIVLTLIMGLFGALLFKKITKRFRTMVTEVSDIAEGSFESTVSEAGNDEVAQLGKAINQMSQTIVGSLKETESADRERREMVAMVVHDLGSPLAAVRGWIELLLSDETSLDKTKQQEQLRKILRNVERLSNMIKELFELSKLDTKDISVNKESFSISELATEEILPRFRELAETKNVDLRVEAPEELFVVADQELVDKVLKNLTENAIRHNFSGGKVVIRIESINEDKVGISITDNGPGIPREDLPHIFKRFYRGQDSSKRHEKGGGLGLAIVKRALEIQGEKIEVKSEVNKGTTFSFELDADVSN